MTVRQQKGRVALTSLLLSAIPMSAMASFDTADAYFCEACTSVNAALAHAEQYYMPELRCESAQGGETSPTIPSDPDVSVQCWSEPNQRLVLLANPDTHQLFAVEMSWTQIDATLWGPVSEHRVIPSDLQAEYADLLSEYDNYRAALAMMEEDLASLAMENEPNAASLASGSHNEVMPPWYEWNVGSPADDDTGEACPSGTALEALTDPEARSSVMEAAQLTGESRLKDQIREGTRATESRFSLVGRFFGSGGDVERGVKYGPDHRIPTSIRAPFFVSENGAASLDDPDYLQIDFSFIWSLDGDVYLQEIDFNYAESRILGERRLLAQNSTTEIQDECALERMRELGLSGLFSHIHDPVSGANFGPTPGGGGWSWGSPNAPMQPSGGCSACIHEFYQGERLILRMCARCDLFDETDDEP
ncbi:hypothetical protein VCB98_13365 [Gammaproteobacteria bacterium AB-CW1]|uniref:Uncharacterized protein n=1 Tax=Natronospira elongata TaxID=3110268 RepID=A0AAP6JGY2_9GAMM|nr:hypothetical protein [Gammaproteobacteria bacterium AB-CW1]